MTRDRVLDRHRDARSRTDGGVCTDYALSLGGGLLGIVFGFLGAALVARIAGWDTIVPMYGIVLSLGVAGTVGVIFGVGPARAAANLDPVAALRQE